MRQTKLQWNITSHLSGATNKTKARWCGEDTEKSESLHTVGGGVNGITIKENSINGPHKNEQ